MKKPKIFLSYVQEDREKVEELYQKLFSEGFDPWMDKHGILPGENFRLSIDKAMRNSDFVFIFLSSNSVVRRSFFQTEIRKALDFWREKLESDNYLIPVRLDDCEVPESLRDLNWVDLFKNDGFERLVTAVREGARRRNTQSNPLDKKQGETSVGTQNSNTSPVMQNTPQSESIAIFPTDGNTPTRPALDDPEIANRNLWIREHRILVEIRPNKRVIRQMFDFSAHENDVDLYRFKLKPMGSGNITNVIKQNAGRPSDVDDQKICFGQNIDGWEFYAVVFCNTLKPRKSKQIFLTIEVSGDMPPFHALSYADVAGCDKLSMSVKFFDSLFPAEVQAIRYDDKDWKRVVSEEEIYVRREEKDQGTREYLYEITPKQNIKYMVKWQLPPIR